MVRMAARIADGIFLSGCSPAQHESIAAAMDEVNPSAQMTLYQSASDVVESPSVSDWDSVGAVLAVEVDRWHPAAIGINLVDLNDGQGDPVALVERAAEILKDL